MGKVNQFNEKVAVNTTLVFGTMWTTYVFFLYGFLPVIFPQEYDKIMYWSSTVQLWALPLIMVGQNVMGRSAERRAQQDHDTLMAEFKSQQDEVAELHAIILSQGEVISDLHKIMQKLGVTDGNSTSTCNEAQPDGGSYYSIPCKTQGVQGV